MPAPRGYGSRDFRDDVLVPLQQRLETGEILSGLQPVTPSANIRQTDPKSWQPLTGENVKAAARQFLKGFTSNLERSGQNVRAYQDALAGKTPVAIPGVATPQLFGLVDAPSVGADGPDNKQMTQQLLNAFSNEGLSFSDQTGRVTLTPGGMNIVSPRGWSAGVNPMGGEVTVGPVGLRGTWSGDKSIEATFNFRPQTIQPRMKDSFLTPEPVEESEYPYYGFGLEQNKPPGMHGPTVDIPLSAGRQLMEQQTEEYMRRNPNYRYQ